MVVQVYGKAGAGHISVASAPIEGKWFGRDWRFAGPSHGAKFSFLTGSAVPQRPSSCQGKTCQHRVVESAMANREHRVSRGIRRATSKFAA